MRFDELDFAFDFDFEVEDLLRDELAFVFDRVFDPDDLLRDELDLDLLEDLLRDEVDFDFDRDFEPEERDEDDFASPAWARCLLTVRAAISFARSVDSPFSCSDSLMCSYWRSRLALHA